MTASGGGTEAAAVGSLADREMEEVPEEEAGERRDDRREVEKVPAEVS